MYQYNQIDQKLVDERVAQFADQMRRYLAGDLTEDEFRVLRLQNGVYIQKHAPMLRVAIPYGLLSSQQLLALADIADEYDRGYGHVSTRQNMQFNWPKLETIPAILGDLAKVQMHAIQTSGNCIRNTTTDPLAGVTPDEVADPRPYCEIIRQWSTLNPEFAYLPRKFKIAVSGASVDRVAVRFHDIGLYLRRNDAGELGFAVYVGGGMGRTPLVSQQLCAFLPTVDLLSYLEAVLRVYNLQGNRDNKYKARIKILVKAIGIEALREQVEAEWQFTRQSALKLDEQTLLQMQSHFSAPAYKLFDGAKANAALAAQKAQDADFSRFVVNNTRRHKMAGYRIVYIALKNPQSAPGDITSAQMRGIAALAAEFSFAELRTTHDQNIVLADVAVEDLWALYQKLCALGLARANIGLLTDMICCPGLDFCALADARSLPIAKELNRYFDNLDYVHDIGRVEIKMSGCMNACGHHHAGHIGIMGRETKGEEFYTISLGGSGALNASVGKVLGPALRGEEVAPTIKKIFDFYLQEREGEELFIDTYHRLGMAKFKEVAYV